MENRIFLIKTSKKRYKRQKFNKRKNFIKKTFVFLVVILIAIISIKLTFKKRRSKYINKYIDETIDINKIKNFNEKVYWKNETSIDIFKIREDIKKVLNTQISYENKNDFIERKKPAVSLVITIYNQEKYIKLVYSSILQQELKDIEIIFINDASTDNSEQIVKELMEKDKRIVYLKNEVNKRTFCSRNRGILEAKGEYILVIDPDDIIINNILIKAYVTAKKYDLDMVQFYMLIGYRHTPHLWRELKYKSGFLRNNTEVRNIFYNSISRNLCDKLIRREVYVKSVKFMKEEFYNENYRVNDDDTAFFGLVHVAETYAFLEQVGYFYISRYPGTPSVNPLGDANKKFRSIFNIMKYFYLQSDDNTLEKSKMAYGYYHKSMNNFYKYIPEVTEGFDFIYKVFDLYLNSPYLDKTQKDHLNKYKTKFMEREKAIKK